MQCFHPGFLYKAAGATVVRLVKAAGATVVGLVKAAGATVVGLVKAAALFLPVVDLSCLIF